MTKAEQSRLVSSVRRALGVGRRGASRGAPLFRTSAFRVRYEAQAWENLAAELARLRR